MMKRQNTRSHPALAPNPAQLFALIGFVFIVLALAIMPSVSKAEGEVGSGAYEAMRQDWQRQRRAEPVFAPSPRFIPRLPIFRDMTRYAPPQAARLEQPMRQTRAAVPYTTRSQISGRDIPLLTVRPLQNVYGALDQGFEAPLQPLALPRKKPMTRADRDDDDEADTENPAINGPQAYCVRACDGFFFPAGPAMEGKGKEAQNFYCQTACPGSEVALYTAQQGETIENAIGPKGQSYLRLKTAFQFRSQLSPSCSCSAGVAHGLSSFPITHDFTLRRGDLVVNDKGISLFKGASRFPYKNSDFVMARNYSRLPSDVRRTVSALESGRAYGEPGRIGSLRSMRMPPIYAANVQPVSAGTMTEEGVRVLDLSRPKEEAIPVAAVAKPEPKAKKKRRARR